MIDLTKRKSLREFSFTTKCQLTGDKLKVHLAYDLTVNQGGFYIGVSVNGAPESTLSYDLARLTSLNHPAINMILSLTDVDSSGCAYGLYDTVYDMMSVYAESYQQNPTNPSSVAHMAALLNELSIDCDFSLIKSDGVLGDKSFEKMKTAYLKKYNSGRYITKGLYTIVARYCDSQRLRLLERVRECIRLIRAVVRDGITIDDKLSKVRVLGWLRTHPYPSYYKRDTDYIRKNRERICVNVLGTEYTPA